MEVKSKVFKRKSGKSEGKWIVRLEYFDESRGKTCYMERQANKRADAIDLRNELEAKLKKTQGQIQTGERMTFNDLAAICEKIFYQPATIIEGKKVSGVRSVVTAQAQLMILKKFFGKRLLNDITTESLHDYKLWRLKTVSGRTNKAVKISTVNRELSAFRRMFNYALRKRWVLYPIFAESVIDPSAEIERTRLLTKDEEKRLLAACEGERFTTYTRTRNGRDETITARISVENPHLKAMITLALDSAMRLGEIFKLRWQDIDFDNNMISIIGTHTKTERPRVVPLSKRAASEIEKVRGLSVSDNPFPLKDIKRSFSTAKKLAGVEDLHFHDLRRTCITRWIAQGTPLALAGKLAGHTQAQTTQKHYISTDAASVKEIAERMDAFNELEKAAPHLEENELLN